MNHRFGKKQKLNYHEKESASEEQHMLGCVLVMTITKLKNYGVEGVWEIGSIL